MTHEISHIRVHRPAMLACLVTLLISCGSGEGVSDKPAALAAPACEATKVLELTVKSVFPNCVDDNRFKVTDPAKVGGGTLAPQSLNKAEETDSSSKSRANVNLAGGLIICPEEPQKCVCVQAQACAIPPNPGVWECTLADGSICPGTEGGVLPPSAVIVEGSEIKETQRCCGSGKGCCGLESCDPREPDACWPDTPPPPPP